MADQTVDVKTNGNGDVWEAKAAPPLRSARLLLRPIRPDDEEALFVLRADPAVMYWSMRRVPDENIEQTRTYSRIWVRPECLNLAIEETVHSPDGDGLCGVVGFHCDGDRVDLGYMLLPRVWGRGYATEAVRAARDAWAADYAGARSAAPSACRSVLWASIFPENEPSRRVLLKCGFTQVFAGEDEYGKCEDWSWEVPQGVEAVAESKN